MSQIDVASIETVAEKIEELVYDRDFLGWAKQKSAANIIVRLVEKASNEVREEESLYEARELLDRLYPGDRQRKEMVVREALTVLRAKRDGHGVVVAPRPTRLQSELVFHPSYWPDVVQREAMPQASVPSPFLEPQQDHSSLQG